VENKVFFSYLGNTEKRISEFFEKYEAQQYFKPTDIYDSVFSYIRRPAKRLRPSVLLMAAGSLGGDDREKLAIPAAAGVELFHTWTLVHDDLIDNDNLRRGEPTVHKAMSERSKKSLGVSDGVAKEYGRDIAVLAGDIQHGWSIAAFVDCALHMSVDPMLILKLIKHLQSYVIGNLICGEVLDVQYGMAKGMDIFDIDEEKIINMLWLKTGVLYEFAGLAGALIGKNSTDFEDEQVLAIKNFAGSCGTAFQLQDDILGILGDEKSIGKPVGSDIREGKKTVIVYESIKNASASEKNKILSVLGNKEASPNEVSEVTVLFQELGGTERTGKLAKQYLEKALPHLDVISDSKYKNLLVLWADFMINRKF
jgi:geranylgeranyl diphosphate synthase type I